MKYDIILSDPPWGYANWTKKKNGAAVSHYKTLTDKNIIDLPMQNVSAKDSMIFLWTTWPKLDVAMKALDAWGFEYVSCVRDWVKTKKSGNGEMHHGIGFWALGGSEFVLMGRRGNGFPRRRDTRGHVLQVEVSPVRGHSQKPEGMHDHIAELIDLDGLKKIELFARSRVPGWDATGLDLDGVDIRDFLKGASVGAQD